VSRARRSFTRVILLFISGLGLLSAILLLADPPSPDVDQPSGLFGMNSALIVSQRSPASIEHNVPAAAKGIDTILDFSCTDQSQIFETASPRFRLKGPTCAPEEATVLSTRILNKSNGYMATVFHHNSQFTTDYINLVDGRNDIEVKFETEKGVIQKTLQVVRSAPALTSKHGPTL